MNYELALAGILISWLMMVPLAIKWKLPRIPVLAGISAVSVMAALLFAWIYPLFGTGWWLAIGVLGQVGLTLVVAFALAMWRFWRDPDRVPPEKSGVVLSPADGKVLEVRSLDKGSTPLARKSGRDYLLSELTGSAVLNSAVHVIPVEMNLLDVHVNRCPVTGRVKLLNYIEGQFISLRREEAPFVNARLTTVIENPSLPVAVVQIASRLVRRVEGYLNVGQLVDAGQRLGIIRFGSLVVVIVPQTDGLTIEVEPGQHVKAGVSILARFDTRKLEDAN